MFINQKSVTSTWDENIMQLMCAWMFNYLKAM